MILTTRKHATIIYEVSFAVDCQTKIVKCSYSAKENFEVKIILLPVGCILINKVHWERKYSETMNFCTFAIWRSMNVEKLIVVSPYFQFCLRAENVMGARFSFVIEGIKEISEWFQWDCNLIFSDSASCDRRFLYAKQSVLV